MIFVTSLKLLMRKIYEKRKRGKKGISPLFLFKLVTKQICAIYLLLFYFSFLFFVGIDCGLV